jgi:hypothetical protein
LPSCNSVAGVTAPWNDRRRHPARSASAGPAGHPIHVERDERERVVVVPPEHEAALSRDFEAGAALRASLGHARRQYAEWVGGAKRIGARERRLAKAVELLRTRARHPCRVAA